ncbi:MAG: aspartate aminotransferase family protein [Saprospiraceae bacterium]|nr:aspartate aminotransferase family protein [Saprospiraceae bacterium]
MKLWKKLNQDEIQTRIFAALKQNVNFYEENILGVPGSHLDDRVFYQDAPFLQNAPYLSTLIHNPNHIGCHTLGTSESFFHGTQQIEQELIRVCAEDILHGEENSHDGYVASGGTEANMQAIWIYRNLFLEQVQLNEIAILASEDAHYSVHKASNILQISAYKIAVDPTTREIFRESVEKTLQRALADGKKRFILFANMMTTMFGSVDDPDVLTAPLEALDLSYFLHVDGAYGGFFYPFATKNCRLDFTNPKVTSVTLDAHKMVQAPYGTGIFLIRKNFIQYASTRDASYVEGEDSTIIGSRSGANAIAVWMILMKNGPYGWKEKILTLLNRANWFTEKLDELNIAFYRHAQSNIITIREKHLNSDIAQRYGLVPDDHHQPQWYKVVIMDHVSIEKLLPLVADLQAFAEKKLV